MHFGENQLSPGSIGISPLPTALPSRLQPTLVRASIPCYRDFSLAMGASPGFGSTARYLLTPSSDSLSLRLRKLCLLNRQRTVTRRFILQKARRHPPPKEIGLRLLVGNRFQVLFHSPPGVLFTFPSRYWCTIGGSEYLAFGGGPPEFPQGFPASGAPVQPLPLDRRFLTLLPGYRPAQRPHDPALATPVGLARVRFR